MDPPPAVLPGLPPGAGVPPAPPPGPPPRPATTRGGNKYSNEQRTFMAVKYHEFGKEKRGGKLYFIKKAFFGVGTNLAEVFRAYCNKFPDSPLPHKSTILYQVKKLELKRRFYSHFLKFCLHAYFKKTCRDSAQSVQGAKEDSCHCREGRASPASCSAVSIFCCFLIIKFLKYFNFRETTYPPYAPRSSARRNPLDMAKSSWSRARKEAKLFGYVMRHRQELRPEDYGRRLRMCQWLLEQPAQFWDTLVMTDECRQVIHCIVLYFKNQNVSFRFKPLDST